MSPITDLTHYRALRAAQRAFNEAQARCLAYPSKLALRMADEALARLVALRALPPSVG